MPDYLINWLLYCGLDKEKYASIEDRIYSRNMRMLRTAAVLVTALGFLYVFVSLFVPVGNVWLYAFVGISGALTLGLAVRFRESHSKHTLLISHFLLLCVTIYGIILSFLSGHFDRPSTSIIVFLVILPLVIIDRPLRMYLVILVYTVIFLLLSYRLKTPDAFLTDFVNTVTDIFLGLVVYSISVRINVSELYHNKRIETMNIGIIRSLASTIDAKDHYTRGHSQRVADYALMLAKKMGKSETEQQIIYNAGLLHDIGKIRVAENIINKEGKLTDDEFDQIKVHPSSGFHILRNIQSDELIGYSAKYHHERYDGSGYPNGLSGEDIPEIARIIAVADSYDAMASDRSYRKALPQDVVRSELVKGRGTQFDPKIADCMIEIMDADVDYSLREKDDDDYRILIIDDEAMNIRIVKHVLKDMHNISIVAAQTKEEALASINERTPDLILMDLKMPDTDGFALYRIIRENRRIPTILMTGDRSKETLQAIRDLGMDDYLTKPLNPLITKETVYGILHS